MPHRFYQINRPDLRPSQLYPFGDPFLPLRMLLKQPRPCYMLALLQCYRIAKLAYGILLMLCISLAYALAFLLMAIRFHFHLCTVHTIPLAFAYYYLLCPPSLSYLLRWPPPPPHFNHKNTLLQIRIAHNLCVSFDIWLTFSHQIIT